MNVTPIKTLPQKRINKTGRMPIAEAFVGINGEGLKSGAPATFFRFAGCNLSCNWCDTKWANDPDCPVVYMTPEEIYHYALDKGIPNITLTGGEPLIQPLLPELLRFFIGDSYFSTEIETNGSLPLDFLRRSGDKLSFTLDCKLPSSGHETNMVYKHFGLLGKRDAVKFVAETEDDLEEIIRIIDAYSLAKRTNIFISPVYNAMKPETIADFLIENHLEARLMLQLHKVIWGENKRMV
jgi:7-carboxy-7-deazaguanine synthase